MGWFLGGGRRRARVALTTLGLLALAACAGTDRDDASPVANRSPEAGATEVLGATAARDPIVVSPYERQAFLEVALRSASAVPDQVPVLSRWRRAPTVAIRGTTTPEDLRQVVAAVQQWSLATGRSITLGPADGDIELIFEPKAEFAATLGATSVDPNAVGLTRVRHVAGQRGVLDGATVVIASDDHQVGRNRTITHELGHALGLQHSTCASSLMDGSSSGERSVRWSLSALDVRMAGLLYDARLTPGAGVDAVDDELAPTATAGAVCGPVDLELIRAAGSGRQYLCEKSDAHIRPCTGDLSREPTLPIRDADVWTDGATLHRRPPL